MKTRLSVRSKPPRICGLVKSTLTPRPKHGGVQRLPLAMVLGVGLVLAALTVTAPAQASDFQYRQAEADSALKRVLEQIRSEKAPISAFQYTADGEWILIIGKRRWYSDATYFARLRGGGREGLRAVVERALRAGRTVRSLSIDEHGRWAVVLSDGSVKLSAKSHFDRIGLSRQIKRLGRHAPSAIYLGPKRSWVLVAPTGKLHHRGLPADMQLILDTIAESKARLSGVAFRLRKGGGFNYVVTAGSQFWKSGRVGTSLWRGLSAIQAGKGSFSKVALAPGKGFVVASQRKSRPSRSDVLGQMELQVRGQTVWERMRHHRVPGMSVAFVRNGRIEDVRAYGHRSRTNWAHVNNETLFAAASTSKAVASAGMLKAHEERKLGFDKTVQSTLNGNTKLTTGRSWMKGLSASNRRRFMRATFASLLNYSSGLSIHGIGLSPESTRQTVRDIVVGNAWGGLVPKRDPLTGYLYSGGAYSLAETIIEQSYGRSFPRYMKDKLLTPAGMTSATFYKLPTSRRANFAYGHDNHRRLPYRVCVGKAAGGLTTTARDYAKFLLMVMGGGLAPNGRRILQPVSHRRLITPAYDRRSTLRRCRRDSDCKASSHTCEVGRCMIPIMSGSKHLGLGLRMSTLQSSAAGMPITIEHGGSQEGYSSYFYGEPGRRTGIVILTNGDCTLEQNGKRVAGRGGCNLKDEILAAYRRFR